MCADVRRPARFDLPHMTSELLRHIRHRTVQSTTSSHDGVPCLEWVGGRSRYGKLSITVDGRRRNFKVHRLIANAFIRPLRPGDVVLHECDNEACCEVLHLRVSTQAENIAQAVKRGSFGQKNIYHVSRQSEASPTHCGAGHPRIPENNYHKGGGWKCRECQLERTRERQVRLNAAGFSCAIAPSRRRRTRA